MKHKHYDLIVAWASGAEIQWRDPKHPSLKWDDVKNPQFWNDFEYRIKPTSEREPCPECKGTGRITVEKKPVVRWLWATKWQGDPDWRTSSTFYTTNDIDCLMGEFPDAKYIKLEWSRTEFPE